MLVQIYKKNKSERVRNEKRGAVKIKLWIITKYRNRNGYSSFLFLYVI